MSAFAAGRLPLLVPTDRHPEFGKVEHVCRCGATFPDALAHRDHAASILLRYCRERAASEIGLVAVAWLVEGHRLSRLRA